jgi:hypothetical protein
MNTLRERFLSREDFTHEGVLAFFRQELLALAEEVESIRTEEISSHDFAGQGYNMALKHTAALIRNRANEIV